MSEEEGPNTQGTGNKAELIAGDGEVVGGWKR